MPHYQAWEEFMRAAEKLYLADPMKEEVLLQRPENVQRGRCFRSVVSANVKHNFSLQKKHCNSARKQHKRYGLFSNTDIVMGTSVSK
ncbi:signal recognition particle 9 kDa protein isoform X2 [Colius striatus]|uniref:signal recognition particle 9 kDa protein isoform X2 n=1 Tax=Colius striatus TaxID=57412 RepID=UPI002B1CF11A|nr:signal recognition particle 9 kDa protein isoform X2 [Colius striatus]